MTKYVITKNITCTDPLDCSTIIISKLETLLGGKLHVDSEIEQAKGHISISHEQGNHKIWVFLYDIDNEHEGDTNGTTIMTPSNRVRRWDLAKPPNADLEAVLD